jgi:hypothetical protein
MLPFTSFNIPRLPWPRFFFFLAARFPALPPPRPPQKPPWPLTESLTQPPPQSLAFFDAGARAAVPPALTGRWSAAPERRALEDLLEAAVDERRLEGGAGGDSLFGDDDDDDAGGGSGFEGVGQGAGLRGFWRRLPKRWKAVITRALPLVVNYVQSLHTLISRRRAAVRQDRLLPVMPLF